ncbi:MAG: Ltp family lipoprotein, partial [Candidatus Methanomethylophilaceae archaeon]|nr:Ltp family lipoprotein [Candidatus Methanomethylophilaceae archaeon]
VDALGISAERLKEFLLDNGFTESHAIYGVANCGADWDAEALEYARSLLEYSSYSESDLLESLLDEGFTDSQSRRAVESVFQ